MKSTFFLKRSAGGAAALLLAAASLAVARDAVDVKSQPPNKPAARAVDYPWMSVETWKEKHARHVERSKQGGVDILFVGDSITEGWDGAGREAWEKHFAPRKAANFGIGGDTTQNVLWRLEHGALDQIAPKTVVVLIGTNNFGLLGQDPSAVADGVKEIVGKLRDAFPEARIILHAVFPRGQKSDDPMRARIANLNAELESFAKGAEDVAWLDVGSKLTDPDGSISPDIMPDFLHLSPQGYQIWADALTAALEANSQR